MSDANSLAAFRRTLGTDLGALAEEHYRHEYVCSSSPLTCLYADQFRSLTDSDRALLLRSASTLSVSATVGSVAGVTLGLLAGLRLRRNRAKLFTAMRTAQRPASVTFADGRTEAVPDLTPLMRPTRLGDWFTYTLFAAGGLFLGGELGLLGGGFAARKGISEDYEARKRIEGAFWRFRAEVLRNQADEVENGSGRVGF